MIVLRSLTAIMLLAAAGVPCPQSAAALSSQPAGSRQPKIPPRRFHDCAGCPEMVVIPAGSAILGSTSQERAQSGITRLFGDREGPRYRVRFAHPYAIGESEVTRGQYAEFASATQRPDPSECGVHDAAADSWTPKPGFNWRHPGFPQDDNHPAVCISYNDAAAYAAWLAKRTGKPYRLPSDAEWEYAARAGSETPWYWGEAPETGCGIANILSDGTIAKLLAPKSMANRLACSSGRSFTVPVKSFPPNAFGVYDTAGNAFEWVADCNNPDNRGAHRDGSARMTGDCSRHYLKGGAFNTPLWLTRAAVRGAPISPDLRMFSMGFRVARALD